MKILELNFEKSWRGGERQTLFNALGLRNENIEVAFLCRKGFPLEQKAFAAGFKVYSFSNILGVIAFLIFKGRQYNILHTQTSHLLTYCIATKWLHGCKVVFTRRIILKPKGTMTRLKYRSADCIVGISKAIQKTISKFTEKGVVLISDAIEMNNFLAPPNFSVFTKTPEANGKKILLTVAAMTSDKDPLVLVKAITELALYRKDFILLHLGDGPLKGNINQLIAQNNIQDFYKCIGHTDLVNEYFAVADVFVLSSKEEGLGSSVLDAFYMKVPCATTDSGGLAELLDQERGLLCQVGDYQQLARNIGTILDQGELKNHMVNSAYDYVINNHSIEAIGRKYTDLFKQLTSSKK